MHVGKSYIIPAQPMAEDSKPGRQPGKEESTGDEGEHGGHSIGGDHCARYVSHNVQVCSAFFYTMTIDPEGPPNIE